MKTVARSNKAKPRSSRTLPYARTAKLRKRAKTSAVELLREIPVHGSRVALARLDAILLRALALAGGNRSCEIFLADLGKAAHGLRALRAIMSARGLVDDGTQTPEGMVAP